MARQLLNCFLSLKELQFGNTRQLKRLQRKRNKLADFFQVTAGALAQSVSVMGRPFFINGVEHSGVIDELKETEKITIGGFETTLAASIVVNKLNFTPPAVGTKLTVNNIQRRVIAVNEDAISYTIHLENINR